MAVIPETAPAPASAATRWRRFLTPWRSPADQPDWARPALLVIAVVAAVAYGWGMAGASVEPFYGAAARSMSESWHDFIFGAFDPAGTVTVDKLPGALWVQALLLRLSGIHIWAVILPQVVEGVLTILVLYRAVRRWRARGRPSRRRLAHGRHRAVEPREHLRLAPRPAARAGCRRHHGHRADRDAGQSSWPDLVGFAFQAKMSRPGSCCPRSPGPTCSRAGLEAADPWRTSRWPGSSPPCSLLDDRRLARPAHDRPSSMRTPTTPSTRRSSTTTAWAWSAGTGPPSPGRPHRS